MAHIHHGIDYIELAVSDMAATTDFYTRAFGWRLTDYGPGYAGITGPDGREIGGLNAESVPSAGGPLVLLYSEDLEATAAAITAAGGEVTAGPYPFPGGRRLHFTDPSGNALGVWSAR